MRSWSIIAGRFFGVELRIHVTFLFLLLFVVITGTYESGYAPTVGVARGLGLVAIIFGSVVLHELGHALVARRTGVPVRGVMLLPIGGMTLKKNNSPRTEQAKIASRLHGGSKVLFWTVVSVRPSGGMILQVGWLHEGENWHAGCSGGNVSSPRVTTGRSVPR